MRGRAAIWMKVLTAAVVVAVLPACSVALHGHETSGGGAATTATSGSVNVLSTGSHHGVAASFGRPVAPTAPGGHVSVSGGTGAAVLLLGIVVVHAIDYLSGSRGGGVTRPIAHTCSCYGYRPDETSQPPRE